MDIISELQYFYDAQADKFHETRNKHWPEFELILDAVEQMPFQDIEILEIWCGSGRLCKYLKTHSKKNIKYTWVDISNNLLEIAKSQNPDSSFIHWDMDRMLNTARQEKYDVVIWVASFQHLDTDAKRAIVMRWIYRVLKYQGKVIMTNWAMSDWFKKRYKKEVRNAFFKSIFTFWNRKSNDIIVPWKTWDDVFHRYYHMFSLSELQYLLDIGWFITQKLIFIDNNGQTATQKNARNSFLVWAKEVVEYLDIV